MDCSLPGSSVHGTSQARILEWVAISFSNGSSWPRVRTQISCIVVRFFTDWATREALVLYSSSRSKSPTHFLLINLRALGEDTLIPQDIEEESGKVGFALQNESMRVSTPSMQEMEERRHTRCRNAEKRLFHGLESQCMRESIPRM